MSASSPRTTPPKAARKPAAKKGNAIAGKPGPELVELPAGTGIEPQPTGKKIAIVGFTGSRDKAPWGDPEWEIWICNNLWKLVPDQWHALFDLHDHATITSDPEQTAFLSGQDGMRPGGQDRVNLNGRPVVVWEPLPEWQTAVPYPKAQTLQAFRPYFSNSISWMIAAAIAQQATEIHIYGVDMATNTEYAAQRPSCEYFIGLAEGMGIKVHVPDESDLLKVAFQYGADDDSPLRAKLEDRIKELAGRKAQLENQMQHEQIQHAQIVGALDNTNYFKNVWLSPHANRDGTPKTAEEQVAA